MIARIIRHIDAFRSRKSVKLLDTLYGPRALPLRTQVAALMLDRKVTGSDKAAQYGNLRIALLKATGITNDGQHCKAWEDAEFETKAAEILTRKCWHNGKDPGTICKLCGQTIKESDYEGDTF